MGTVVTGLIVQALNRSTAPGIAGRAAVIVLAYAAGNVIGDAGIQRTIAAFENIEKPGRVLSRALVFQRNHRMEILTKKDANIKTILLRQRTTHERPAGLN